MKKNKIRIYFILSIFLFFEYNLSAYPILLTTRSKSLSAFTGIADDVSSILFNPAGLSTLNNHEIFFNSSDIYNLGIKHNQLFYTLPIHNNINFGLAISTVSFKDSELDVSEKHYIAALSSKLYKNLYGGITLRFSNLDAQYLNSNQAEGNANSYDAGLLYSAGNFRAGFNYFNITNKKIKYSDGVKSNFSDRYARFGASYKTGRLTAGIDYDANNIIYAGGQYEVFKNILLLFTT